MNDCFADFYLPPFDPAYFVGVADAPGVIVLYDGTQPIYLAATSSARYWLRAHWAERNNPTEDIALWRYVSSSLSNINFAVKFSNDPTELAEKMMLDLFPRFNFPSVPRPRIANLEELGKEVLLARAKLSPSGFLLFCDLAIGSHAYELPSMKELHQALGAPDAATFGLLLREVRTYVRTRERAQLGAELEHKQRFCF